jgi:hypothetical protein
VSFVTGENDKISGDDKNDAIKYSERFFEWIDEGIGDNCSDRDVKTARNDDLVELKWMSESCHLP